jgi:hypothetical protein
MASINGAPRIYIKSGSSNIESGFVDLALKPTESIITRDIQVSTRPHTAPVASGIVVNAVSSHSPDPNTVAKLSKSVIKN